MANVSSSNGLEKYPKLRFKGFSEPWEHVKLSDFVSRVTRKNSDNQTDIPLTISSKDGLINQNEFFSKQVASKDMSGYYLLQRGEFAYNKSYSVGFDFGSIKRLEKYDQGALSTLYICFALDRFDSDFIKHYFDSLKWYREIYMISAEGARNHGLLNVPTEDFFATLHALPMDAAEQRKIAEFLDLLTAKIEKQQSLVDNLKKYKRGLLSSLLDKEEWQTVLMQDVASGFDYGMNSAATEYDGKHKYIRITDIDESTHKYISTECVSPSDLPEAKYKVEENDILFARTGASVGKSYIYDSRDGELYYAGFLIRASVKPDFNSYFVYLNTLTLGYQRWVVLESTRSGQPGINAEQYRNYKFKCPPIEIQNKIANIFIHFDLKLQREQEILDYLLNYKKAMMRNIFV